VFPGDFRRWLVLRASVAATVSAAEGMESVNVYFNGMEPGYVGRALGAMPPVEGALDVYLDNLRQEYEVLPGSAEAGSYESRVVTLYFLDTARSLLLGSNRQLHYDRRADNVTILTDILEELILGPRANGLEPVLPADLALSREPELETVSTPFFGSSSGQSLSVIDLLFVTPSQGFDERLACGSIVLTLTGYIPQITGVRISFAGSDGKVRNASLNGYFTRDDFTDLLGQPVTVAFPDPDGSALYRVERAVPQSSIYDAGARLAELFRGPADPGVLYPVFTESDADKVYISGDTAVINWKEGLSKRLSELMEAETSLPRERREQLFVFSVVNTVTEIPGISRVLMLENGRRPASAGRIWFGNPLLRNPKLYVED
jgi:spore germination protein GerM